MRNLSAWFDSHFSMSTDISTSCSAAFFWLHNIKRTLQLGCLCHVKSMTSITPILINLHWLPVRYRISFKILLLTFKALYGMAPSYIIDLIHTKTHTRYLLRSNEGVLLKHPSRKMKKSFGDRSFSVAAPTLWNALIFLLASAASNVFLLLSLNLTFIFLN